MYIEKTIETYMRNLDMDAKGFFTKIRALMFQANPEVKEVLFANQPYFYLEKYASINSHRRPSVMMSIFKDHMNIFSTYNKKYMDKLPMYKFTPKHTLQIYFEQELEEATLIDMFKESLESLESIE